jgi:hypothetical protein
MIDCDVIMRLKVGDAIRLVPTSKEGLMKLTIMGADLWTIMNIKASVCALRLNPGVLIKREDGKFAQWLSLNDPDLVIEQCKN